MQGASQVATQHVVRADVASQIFGFIIGLFQSVWNGIQSFFGTIFQSFANLIASIFNAPVQAINAAFQQLTNSTAAFGPLAPIITVAVIMLVVILVFAVAWIIIRLSVSEAEETGSEVEEGV